MNRSTIASTWPVSRHDVSCLRFMKPPVNVHSQNQADTELHTRRQVGSSL